MCHINKSKGTNMNIIRKTLNVAAVAAGAVLTFATAALAAGSGTGIESGFTEVGTDLDTLLNGAGGFLIVIVSVAVGAVMLAVGRGWGPAITAFAVSLFIGYGVSALTGIAGVTGGVDLMASELVLDATPPVQ